jgi:hypothetical protein
MASSTNDGALFTEEQRFRQPWLWLIIALTTAPAVFVVYGYYQQVLGGVPWGDRPLGDAALTATTLAVLAFDGALIWFMWASRLLVKVYPEGLYVRFYPLCVKRRLTYDEIARFAAVTYSPLTEYGGWGVRGLKANKAYNVSGKRGVRLLLTSGHKLLLGSQRAEALEAAIAEASGRDATPETG